MAKVDFDDYAEDYDKILQKLVNFFGEDHEYFAEYKMQIVFKYCKGNPLNILEYGCGTGRNLKFIKKQFKSARIFGCDISEESLKLARDENPDSNFFLIGKDTASQKFDLIVVAGLFHHLDPKLRINSMVDISNLINANGEIFVFEQNPYNPITVSLVKSCPFDADAVLVKPKEIQKLLLGVDLHVRKFGYTLFLPGFLRRIRFLESYLMWLPLGGQYFFKGQKIGV